MSINNTLNYLQSKRSEIMLTFSAAVSSTSAYLKGGGGESGDGFPLPKDAFLCSLHCWDGSNLQTKAECVEVDQGDRLSVYATVSGTSFDVKVQVNGVASSLMVSGVAQSTILYATLVLKFK